MVELEKQAAQKTKAITQEMKDFENGQVSAENMVGVKKQEKSYKEMMLQQKKANYQKFRKSIAKPPAKPKVVHLTVSSESNQKRNENSVLSDIHQCPSFQNSSLAQNDSKHEIDQYFEIFEKQ